MHTLTIGNLRQTVFDPDEPIDGFKKQTWAPPAEWGPWDVVTESVIRPQPQQLRKDARFLSGSSAPSCAPSLFAVPYEVLYFEKVDTWIKRLLNPVHGYDEAPPAHQPNLDADDLCAVPV